jgi:hypothetical protein
MAQLLEIQRVVFEDARNEATKPHLRAGLARAWAELEQLKRKIKGKPDPKPIDVSPEMKRKREIDAQRRRMYEGGGDFDPSIPRSFDPDDLPPIIQKPAHPHRLSHR